jgi:ATP-dependent helicase/nuclease subunit A
VSGPIVFDEAAEALFRLSGPTAVSAGAGSGKTTALVELCVRLLSGEALGEPVDPGAIAAITFTERAAEELVVRLRAAVAARAADAARREPGSAEAQAWLERLHGLDRMAAGTIHGFCGRLLREHAPEAGLDPEFTIADEERARAWLAEASRAAVVAALDAGRPAARTLAAGLGAGGAKGGLAAAVAEIVRARATRGDAGPPVPAPAPEAPARRAAWERLAGAAQALARAAAASSSAAAAAIGEVAEELSRELLRAEGQPDEAAPERAGDWGGRYHRPPQQDVLARVPRLVAAAKARRLGPKDAAVRAARDALEEAAEDLARLEAEALGAPQREELAALVADAEARYAARKREARAADFDDLLVLAERLLSSDAALRAELRRRLRALLVDEYQDVNPLQQRIFDLVAGPGVDDRPIPVAVGDLKQSIYRFRGADVSVFARLVRGFASEAEEARDAPAPGRVLRLSRNHRSAPAVLDLVNEVSARCFRAPADGPARDDEILFGPGDRLVATRGEAARPACELLVDAEGGPAAERRAREADALVRRIQAIVSGAAGIAVRAQGEDGVERPRTPRHADVAILFRRLTQIGVYERALREAGIPYRLARGGGFYQAPEVRDLGELVATLFDPGDRIGWAAALRSPMCVVSDATLFLLARAGLPRLARADPLELEREVPAGEWQRLLAFLRTWRELRAVRDRLPLGDLLRRAADALDLDAALLAGPDGERRAVNLEKAIGLARRFEADGGRPAEFGAHLRALAARPPREPEAELEAGDAVAVLSVHQAKGLEWPVVLVPDLGARPRNDARRAFLDEGGRICALLFDGPREEFVETASVRAARDAERRSQAAESRRLLYVALTRARDHLVLSGEAPSGGDTWRALVEAAVAERPDLALRVPCGDAGAFAAGAPLPAAAPPAPGSAPFAAPAAPRLATRPPVAAVRVAVTDLAEYARCPRRHRLARVLALPEPRGASRAPADDPGRATLRGTLAHAMLSETDLGAPPLERRAQMAAAAARRGHDPASPGARRILAEIARFAESEAGRALSLAARQGRLARELPFLLRLDGRGGTPDAYLVGAIDALVVGRRGEGITVVDYKYAVPRPGAVERYRLQLLAYALAARQAHPGARVRARLQFLRGDLRAADVTASAADLERFAREGPALAWDVHRGAGGERSPADLGRDEARCRAEGCGFVGRCFPAVRPGRNPTPAPAPAAPVPA